MKFWILLSLLSTIFYSTVGSGKAASTEDSEKYATTRCLGQEERYFHLNKISDTHYQLNQILINEFADLTGVNIRADLRRRWCRPPYDQGVSRHLFESLFEEPDHGLELAAIPLKDREHARKLRDDFIKRLPALFDQYVMLLMKTAPNVECATQQLPELTKIQEEQQYVGDKVKLFQSSRPSELLKNVLFKLKKIPELWIQCSSTNTQEAPKSR